jgi:hypothetical protein
VNTTPTPPEIESKQKKALPYLPGPRPFWSWNLLGAPPGAYGRLRTDFCWIVTILWLLLGLNSIVACDDTDKLLPYLLSLLSVTVCVTLWINHVAAIREGVTGKRLAIAALMGFLFDILALLARFLAVTIPMVFLFGWPFLARQCDSQRMKVRAVLNYGYELSNDISLRVRQQGSLVGAVKTNAE